MTLETFFEKFDQFADAPGAVAYLRDVVYSVGLAVEKWPHESLESVTLKVTDGTHKTPHYVETGIPFVSVKDFSGGSLDLSATRFITPKEHSEIYKRCDPKRGDILLGRIGTIGKAVVVDTDIEFSLFVSAAQIRPDRLKMLSRYLQYVLNSPFCRAQFDNIKVGGATHTNKLNLKDLRSVKVPLPPLAEQKRIVAKVEELMALCDRLEAQQQEREERAAALARASLTRFAEAPTPANLPFLFHPSYTISPAELRKAILTLAVHGKLVRSLGETEVLPLGEILAEPSSNGISKGPTSDTNATEVLRISAGTSRDDHYVDENDFKHVSLTSKEIENARLKPGDLLACRYNGNLHYVGMFSLYRGESGRIQVNPDKLIRFRVDTSRHEPRYVCLAMNAAPTRKSVEAMCATTAGNIGLSAGRIKTISLPLPPLAEQRRIVAKVDQLMALVDELEAQLAASRTTAAKLLDALVAELTSR